MPPPRPGEALVELTQGPSASWIGGVRVRCRPCGQRFIPRYRERCERCPTCGRLNPAANVAYCPKCGASVDSTGAGAGNFVIVYSDHVESYQPPTPPAEHCGHTGASS